MRRRGGTASALLHLEHQAEVGDAVDVRVDLGVLLPDRGDPHRADLETLTGAVLGRLDVVLLQRSQRSCVGEHRGVRVAFQHTPQLRDVQVIGVLVGDQDGIDDTDGRDVRERTRVDEHACVGVLDQEAGMTEVGDLHASHRTSRRTDAEAFRANN